MPTKFFTNEEENTLLEKFKGVFKHTTVFFFDALVGYFRSSGYFAIRPFIDDVSIRKLIGINVDAIISNYRMSFRENLKVKAILLVCEKSEV